MIGNRNSAKDGAGLETVYGVNSLNQYTGVAAPEPGRAVNWSGTVFTFDGKGLGGATGFTMRNMTYSYDADGNLLAVNDPGGGSWAYGWDAENRLVLASNATVVVSNAYDYLSRRVSKSVFDLQSDIWTLRSQTKFAYDGWNLVSEISNRGSQIVTNFHTWGLDLSGTLYGAGGVGGLLYSSGGTTSVSSVFYTHDGSGNVTDLLDLTAAISNGNAVVARHDYDPFGELLRASGPAAAANPWRFSTRYTDTETGLVMYPKRPYSPILGRWLSRDRIGEKGGPNLYAFVGNQPVNQIDPLGTDAFVAYRRLGIKGLGWTHRVTGHVYLAFNNDNMDGNPGWQQVLQELGYSRQDWHTFSFHPDSVRTGTSAGNKVLVLYTGTSWVDPNNIDADIRPIRDGAAQLILLTKDPCEQVALFRAAHKSYLANQGGNNDRGYYSFMINNCASWAKGIVEGAGLEWPTSARFLNGGTAVGGPMDYTLLPQATYVLAVAGYEGGQAIGVVARGTVSGAQAVAEGAQATVTWVVNNGEWATAPINEGTDNESVGIGVRFSF